jgi:hypothetical protein
MDVYQGLYNKTITSEEDANRFMENVVFGAIEYPETYPAVVVYTIEDGITRPDSLTYQYIYLSDFGSDVVRKLKIGEVLNEE